MNSVFEKTRELGEALMNSEEYKAMKAAEEKALHNEEAARTMGQYLEKRQEIEALLINEQPDPAQLKELSDEMDALQEKLQHVEDIVQLTQTRQAFSGLIDQVNKLLHFIVTGEMEQESEEGDEDEGGCTGSCSSCGGGCHHHHGLN